MTHINDTTEHKSCCDSHAAPETKDACPCTCKKCRKPRYGLWILGFFLFYILSVIPVGLLLYTLKSDLGIDLVKSGGWHTFKHCVRVSLDMEKMAK